MIDYITALADLSAGANFKVMISVINIASKHVPSDKNLEVVGDNINEIIQYILPRIRSSSQDFYRKNIVEELQSKSETIVDSHAGLSIFYTLKLSKC